MKVDRRKLRETRILKGLTQTELAEQAGVTPQVVSLLELGKAKIWLKALRQICAELGLDISEVIISQRKSA